jgi:hypothetical protein
MNTDDASSTERAHVRAHVRKVLRKLGTRPRPRSEAERDPVGSAQKRVKSDREQDDA